MEYESRRKREGKGRSAEYESKRPRIEADSGPIFSDNEASLDIQDLRKEFEYNEGLFSN
jgi:hypothetical protein